MPIKGLMEIHNRGKFHEYTFYGSQVMNVQMFSEQQKVPFLGSFGWFLGHNSRKSDQILSKFRTVIQFIILHHNNYGFWNSIINSKKISSKTTFSGLFRRYLGYTLPRSKADPKLFCQTKDLMKIHNSSKFHLHRICVSQVIYL